MAQLQTGQSAPDFTLPSHEGKEVSLAELRAQANKGVIVYFYPKAATPGGTTEACDFRDNLASLAGAGYTVVGISADPLADLEKVAADEPLTFPVSSATGGEVGPAWGTWG